MDYEKEYKEAFRKATIAYKDEDRHQKATLERIFPQLSESEDEKMADIIRLALANTTSENTLGKYGLSHKDISDWLEKQDEQPKKVFIWKHWKDGICGNGEGKLTYLIKNGDNYSLSSSLGFECDYIELSELDSLMLEKQDEQKPADKVEPKFKVEKDKWYICTQTFVLRGKIVVIKGSTYQAREDNAIHGEDGCLFIDKHDGKATDYFRPWTIQDAKDGDVLQANKCTLIFDSLTKDVDGNTAISSWYFCDSEKFYGMGTSKPDLWNIENITPATKEQRDLLFQKMKEAGYEWDAEKKELKEIEQNTAWSEEDERFLNVAINILNSSKVYTKSPDKYEDTINWLKSLKDRVLPQQKQGGVKRTKQYTTVL